MGEIPFAYVTHDDRAPARIESAPRMIKAQGCTFVGGERMLAG